MRITPTRYTRQLLPSLSLLALALLPPAAAQSIPNPSFEENDPFEVWPGYSSNNADIIGWFGEPIGRVGINPAADPGRDLAGNSPFANNGTIPDGEHVALIQSGVDAPTSLSTTITGLTVGQKYLLTFRANARNNTTVRPRLLIEIDGNELLYSRIMNVANAGAAGEYRYIAVEFTASGTTADLVLTNDEAADSTVVIDAFAIKPATGKWTYDEWFDDATSGIDSAYGYTHAYNLGTNVSANVNGVEFTPVAGGNPSVPGRFAITGVPNVYQGDTNFVGESSVDLATDFIYNGNPGTLTLEGLTPGAEYVLSLFTVAWEDSNQRWITFRAGDDSLSIDQDVYGNDGGVRIDYRYTADATGTLTVSTNPFTADATPNVCTFHLYAFANRLATIPAAAEVAQNPAGGRFLVGDEITLIGTGTGSPPLSYQWKKDGANIAGATTPTLTLNITSGADAGRYTLAVSNAQGSDESDPALVEVWQPAATLPSTGVDDGDVTLPEGEVDPHYTLVVNPEQPGATEAWVHTNNPAAWLANSDTSMWIGPSADTVGAAGPDPTTYVYATPFALPDGATQALISGQWAVDNVGTAIRVNGVPVPGQPSANGFAVFTPFSFTTTDVPAGTLQAGSNTLEFEVVNQGVGYTALRVDSVNVSTIPAGAKPMITGQPVATQTVLTGNSVTLLARAYGSEPLTYQWSKDGAPIGGATSSSLTLNNFSAADVGSYTLTATNSLGSDTSAPAALEIGNAAPTITVQPQGGYFATGAAFNLSVTATGTQPFTYQWTKNGQAVGGNTATLALSGTPADSGTYAVKVTNGLGSVDSIAVEVTVRDAVPGFHNTGDGLDEGSSDPYYTLIVNADGDPDIQAIVQSGRPGAWLLNSTRSRWVGPRENTVDAAGFLNGDSDGMYVYRTTIDLTGFDPASTVLMGQWATDNNGVTIQVNGIDTDQENTAQFASLTDFRLDASNATFNSGLNTIDFVVVNGDATVGYTGLMVANARAFSIATAAPALNVSNLNITLNAQNQPVLTFNGQANASYDIQRSTTLATGSWSKIGSATASAAGEATYTDTTPPNTGTVFYRVAAPTP